MEYESNLEELDHLLFLNEEKQKQHHSIASQMFKGMAEEVDQKIKLNVPEIKPAPPSSILAEALEEAKKITQEKGLKSPEAAVAWDNVEEIAAASSSNGAALGGKMIGNMSEDDCLVEQAWEACHAMAELKRVGLGEK